MKLINLYAALFIILFIYGCQKLDVTDKENFLFIQLGNLDYKEISTAYNNCDTIKNRVKIMILNNPYKHKGRKRLTGSLHNHTDNSSHVDGYKSGGLAANAMKFREAGYDFYAFTDHNYLTEVISVEKILNISKSYEDTKISQHFCIHNLPSNYKDLILQSELDNQIINFYRELNAFIVLNHPDWEYQVISNEQLMKMERVDFVEVLNYENAGSERAFNILNYRFRGRVFGIGADDYHYSDTWSDSNKCLKKSWVELYCDTLERKNIWEHLFAGSFYATKGDTRIDVKCEKGILTIESEYPSKISFIGASKDSRLPWKTTDLEIVNENRGAYTIKGDEIYVYAKIENEGGISITQPVFIENVINLVEK